MSDLFTPSGICEAEVKLHRSRFIAWVCPVRDVNEARERILERSRQFSDATHNCFAYVTGWKRETQYYSDAGEPTGTAGKPILNALLSAGLTNVAAVVTRYYGGVKLGVRGLIDAYGDSVRTALQGAELTPAEPMEQYRISCDYHLAEFVSRLVKERGGRMLHSEYGTKVALLLEIPLAEDLLWVETLDGLKARNGLEYFHIKEL
jgi:uncharacterized YigZ family protein